MEMTVTDAAKEKIRFYLGDKDPANWGVRIVVKARNDFAFSLAEAANSNPTDVTIKEDGLQIFVDEISARQLEGATVDFVEDESGAGFKVTLPEREAAPAIEPDLDFANPLVKKVMDVLMNDINPAIAAHGGMARLMSVKDNVVYLQFGGGCQGCGMVDATLKQGIEVRIKERVPEITGVVDITDHEAGTNPYA